LVSVDGRKRPKQTILDDFFIGNNPLGELQNLEVSEVEMEYALGL
jgi:hypothetical protein